MVNFNIFLVSLRINSSEFQKKLDALKILIFFTSDIQK